MGFDVEGALGRLEMIHSEFLSMVRSTPEDRVDWRPPSEGGDPTTISEQIKHCVDVEAGMATHLFTNEAPEQGEGGDYFASATWAGVGPAGALSAKEDLVRSIEETAQRTAELVRSQPDNIWDEEVDAGFAKMTKAGFVGLLTHHWWWHAGQVAYIQSLYGDISFGS